MDGWVKLWRKLLRSNMYRALTSEQRDVMYACLLLASHDGNTWEWNGQPYTCQPGEFITSLESLNEVTAKNVSIQNIRTALNKLEKWQFLTSQSTKSGRKISIINWGTYQGSQQSSQQSSQQRTNKELTTIKNGKNVQEEEKSTCVNHPSTSDKTKSKPKGYPEDFERFWKAYPRKVKKRETFKTWLKVKKELPPTDELVEIIEQNKTRNRQWLQESGKYIPHPTSWLNQGRWEDQLQMDKPDDDEPIT